MQTFKKIVNQFTGLGIEGSSMITIPKEVYGFQIDDVEIIEYELRYDDDLRNIGSPNAHLDKYYCLSKNNTKIGDIIARYMAKDDERYQEEELIQFFQNWIESVT